MDDDKNKTFTGHFSAEVSDSSKPGKECIVIKTESVPEMSSSIDVNAVGTDVPAEKVTIKCEENVSVIGASDLTFEASIQENEVEGSTGLNDPLPIDIKINNLKVELPSLEDMPKEKIEMKNVTSSSLYESIVSNVEKSLNDAKSKVTLKRRSDSLALISSYQISSDSEEDLTRDSFLKRQVLTESDSESETDSESDGLPVFNIDSDVASESGDEGLTGDAKLKKCKNVIKAPGELDIQELPPIKDLHISVKEEECLPFGKVHSVVETLVVIEALPDVPAINLESVLFTKNGESLGEIFDVFGPVKRPYYTIRFNSRKDIDAKSLSIGALVYCAPKTKYTQYVFIHQLAKMKGSDASWKGDLEPPPGYEEFSDDEEERKAKKERKESRMKAIAQDIIDLDEPPKKAPSFEERMNRQNTIRNQIFSNPRVTPPRWTDWFKNAAPGAGRPMPNGEGTSKGSIVRAPSFTVTPFQSPPPCTPPPFPFSSGNNFQTPPTGQHKFSMRNNSSQPKLFSSSSHGSIFPSQNYSNGNSYPPNHLHNSQILHGNSPGFNQASPAFQQTGQKFTPPNFPSNSQSFQRTTPPPLRSMGGGFQGNSQGWPSNHTFGPQASLPSTTHSFSNGASSFSFNNLPGSSQNHQCKHRQFDNQGIFPSNNTFSSPMPGSYPSKGFGGDSPSFPPPCNKPFPSLFQQNCCQFPPQQGQNFHHHCHPPFSLPNSHPYPGGASQFPPHNHFSGQSQQCSPQFGQNNHFCPGNMPGFHQSSNSSFQPNCRSFPPK